MDRRTSRQRLPRCTAGVIRGLALTALWVVGCSPSEPNGSPTSGDAPVREWQLGPDPEWEIGTIDGPAHLQFSGITSVGLSGTRVILFDRGSAELRVFNLAGEFQAALGGPGEGPGEFSPNVFFEEDRDSLIAFDQRQRRVTYFSPDLEYRSTLPIGLDLLNPRMIGVLGDDSFLMEELILRFAEVTGRDTGELIATRVGADGLSVDTVGVFDGAETVRWSQSGMGLGIFSPYDRLDGDRDGLWVLDGATGHVQLVSVAGDSVAAFTPVLARAPITEQDLDDYFSRLYPEPPPPDVRESIRAKRSVALERGSFPVADRLFVDGMGRVWVRAYSSDPSAAEVWHVFDRSGDPVGRLDTPASFEVHDASANGLVGVYRDQLEVEYVRFYRIPE